MSSNTFFLGHSSWRMPVAGRPCCCTAPSALGHQRIEVIDDREDSCAQRNLRTSEAAGVSGAVPPFVMAQNQRSDGIRERNRADDVGADLRVGADFVELL